MKWLLTARAESTLLPLLLMMIFPTLQLRLFLLLILLNLQPPIPTAPLPQQPLPLMPLQLPPPLFPPRPLLGMPLSMKAGNKTVCPLRRQTQMR